MKLPFIALSSLFLLSTSLAAMETGEAAPAPGSVADCEEAVTVFQDVSRVGRKDRAANNMSKRHAEMAEEGWRFADMEVYTENGDLEGFYLTYVRTTACPEAVPDTD